MQYTFSPLSLVNALVIAIGIGVCLLCFFSDNGIKTPEKRGPTVFSDILFADPFLYHLTPDKTAS